MILSAAPAAYDRRDQADVRSAIADADRENLKRGSDLLLANGERLVLKSPNGSLFALVVSNAGVLSTVAYP